MAYLDFGDSPSPSSASPKRYLISLGSNINPQQHVPLALEKVADHAGLIVLSRAIETEPVGMDSQNRFLNLVAFLETPLEAPQLKATFNAIETALGEIAPIPSPRLKIARSIWIFWQKFRPWKIWLPPSPPARPTVRPFCWSCCITC
jgi:hypothetical protein